MLLGKWDHLCLCPEYFTTQNESRPKIFFFLIICYYYCFYYYYLLNRRDLEALGSHTKLHLISFKTSGKSESYHSYFSHRFSEVLDLCLSLSLKSQLFFSPNLFKRNKQTNPISLNFQHFSLLSNTEVSHYSP